MSVQVETFSPARRSMPLSIRLALAFLASMAVIALIAPLIAPYDFAQQNLLRRLRPPVFWGGDWAYPLGTDNLGRDILSRLIYGVRTSIAVAMAGTLIGAVFGSLLGYLATRRRGLVEEIIMMMVDVQAALPAFFIAIACIALMGSNLLIFIVLVSLEGWERYTRLVRGLVLSQQASGYILAVKALGASAARVDIRHVLPNIAASLVVQMSITFPWVILLETSLSFLGLGIQPPGTSLGQMLGSGRNYLLQAWWIAVLPGMTIFLTTMAMSLVGDWLRDRLDPTLEEPS
ncbi:ABC transporter permease [Rhabdaerophilum sp. SD176]|uniref:ABC transporter permease n=1 Tax=Rhabdaerophilum sp. SD176 TaxID=2983548 RepID=UPI0024E037F9|nr:ABC transporter permease [Rhabdaerophilum sp. SD176]